MRALRPAPTTFALLSLFVGIPSVSADPPGGTTAASSPAPTRAPRGHEQALPQACEQDPFHVDYGAIREGSLVRLGRHRSVDGNANWDPSMEHYVDRVTPVVAARGLDPQGCAIVEVAADGGEYVWRVRDLAIVAEAPSNGAGAVPELRIALGAVPDPRVFDTTMPALARRASTLKPGCAGWVGARPTFTMLLADEFPHLTLMARSRADTILVVRRPSGEFVCVDDVEGRDPVLGGRASAGRYEVYVGGYEPSPDATPVRIGISERSTVRVASLDEVADRDTRPLSNDAGRPTTRLRAGRGAATPAAPAQGAGTPPSAPRETPTEPDDSSRTTR